MQKLANATFKTLKGNSILLYAKKTPTKRQKRLHQRIIIVITLNLYSNSPHLPILGGGEGLENVGTDLTGGWEEILKGYPTRTEVLLLKDVLEKIAAKLDQIKKIYILFQWHCNITQSSDKKLFCVSYLCKPKGDIPSPTESWKLQLIVSKYYWFVLYGGIFQFKFDVIQSRHKEWSRSKPKRKL